MGCSEAETFEINQQTQGIFFTNSNINDLQSKESNGVALRITKNGKLGFVGSSNLDNKDEVVSKAIASADYGDKVDYAFPSTSNFQELSINDKELSDTPIDKLIPRCEEFINTVSEASKNILVDCSFQKNLSNILIQNSNGLNINYQKSLLTFYAEMRLTEKETALEIEMQFDAHNLKDIDEQTYAQRVAAQIPYLLNTRSIIPGKKTVIFTPDCLGDLFFALESGLNGDSVAKGMSPLKGKLNEQVLDEKITIIDDSTNMSGKMAAPFDDEGVPGQKTYLIRNGVLENYIADLKSSAALKQEPTGNGIRSKGIYRVKSYSVKPISDFSNVIFTPGNMSYDDMVESIDDGVIVQSIGGLLLANLNNGDYSGTIAQGLKIEKGKFVGRVTNAMISGNYYEDFRNNLIDFSKEARWVGAFSGQIGSFSIPYAMLKNITIASR